MSNWIPDDALVEKAARAWQAATELGRTPTFDPAVVMVDPHKAMRAALIAARDDMVAEVVRAEAEACAKIADMVGFNNDVEWATEVIADEIRARHP